MDTLRTEMAKETDSPIDVADPFARRLMVQYLGRREDDIVRLRVALGEGRFEDIKIAGHNMSGTGSAYGLDRVSAIGKGIENAATGEDGPEIERLLGDLEKFVHRVRIS